ncbi:hypothetical protein CLU79DRAFT_851167 [Phycomyces nitens]|nr:hypothetical protein CLU79DRAFT_851167 [Phycomyces nitens]
MVKGNDSDPSVIRKLDKRHQERHIHTVEKYGKGSVMVCGCFWAGGLGPLSFLEGFQTIYLNAYVNFLSKGFNP